MKKRTPAHAEEQTPTGPKILQFVLCPGYGRACEWAIEPSMKRISFFDTILVTETVL